MEKPNNISQEEWDDPDGPYASFSKEVIDFAKETAKGKSKEDKENLAKLEQSPIIQERLAEVGLESEDSVQSEIAAPPIQPPTVNIESSDSNPAGDLLSYYRGLLKSIENGIHLVRDRNDRVYLDSSFCGFLNKRIQTLEKEPKSSWLDKL